MLQKKKDILLSAIKKGKVNGIINLGLGLYENKKQFEKVHYKPIALQIEVTTACNLYCKMCIHSYLKELNRNLSLNNFKKLIDSNPYIQKINMTGIGESLMNPNFIEMVEYAKGRGIYVWFSDNMTLINKKNIKKLIEAKVDLISASLDSTNKETFEKIRVGAKFEDVIKNIKQFLQMKNRPLIGINTVVTKQNFKEIEDVIKLVSELKVDCLTFMTAYFGSKNIKSSSFDFISKKELKETVKKAKKTAKKLGVKVLSWPKTEKSKKTGCNLPWTNPYIAYNGDVFPCCFIPQELEGRTRDENIIGNIFKDEFKTMWNNEKYINFRKKIKTNLPPISCRICPNFYGLS